MVLDTFGGWLEPASLVDGRRLEVCLEEGGLEEEEEEGASGGGGGGLDEDDCLGTCWFLVGRAVVEE